MYGRGVNMNRDLTRVGKYIVVQIIETKYIDILSSIFVHLSELDEKYVIPTSE